MSRLSHLPPGPAQMLSKCECVRRGSVSSSVSDSVSRMCFSYFISFTPSRINASYTSLALRFIPSCSTPTSFLLHYL